ncbi:hypothetical protein ACKKBF_B02010 [Auxenochlorella protothecoides x Auxenochlorella symbiontica]
MEVTRHNLQELMPTIRDAIDHASFVAVDCEMTGLFDYEPKPWYLDDMQTRYEDVAANAQKFGLIQIGLAAFAPSLTGLGWVAKTFNFYLFPCALEGTDRRFLSQASSLEFLSGCGFDFNKCIRQGVPYMTAVARDARLARVAREASAEERASQQPPIQLTAQRDIDFKEDFLARVRDWLASDTEEALLLPSSNSFQRAVQHQELRRPQFGAPDPPGFHVEVVKGPSGYNQLRLVKADPEVAAAARAAATSKAQADIHAAAGFTAVLEMLRGAGKPVVGHNAFFDLAFILSSFATPLPPSLRAFKELVRAWFPAGFWDTKHLACQLQAAQPAAAPEDTSLGALYADLEARAAGGVASDPGEGGLIQTAPLPTVGHSVTFDRYDFAGASMLAHEAGYDAFMTGSVFARLAVLLGGAETVQAALPALAASRGRLNVTRCLTTPTSIWRVPIPSLGGPKCCGCLDSRPAVSPEEAWHGE